MIFQLVLHPFLLAVICLPHLAPRNDGMTVVCLLVPLLRCLSLLTHSHALCPSLSLSLVHFAAVTHRHTPNTQANLNIPPIPPIAHCFFHNILARCFTFSSLPFPVAHTRSIPLPLPSFLHLFLSPQFIFFLTYPSFFYSLSSPLPHLMPPQSPQ